MREFKTEIEGYEGTYTFECYENDEPINVGEKFIFFFMGIADVQICQSEEEKFEINPNNKEYDYTKIDLVTGFWRNCYKIKNTNFNHVTK